MDRWPRSEPTIPSKYSNFLWNLYYSGIGVPAGSDPSVGIGLLRAWKSWDPSGAIAARTRSSLALINETNQIWQNTNEFRSRIVDQQSRDVGCLLQGYYVIEDNARHYGLPALPWRRDLHRQVGAAVDHRSPLPGGR